MRATRWLAAVLGGLTVLLAGCTGDGAEQASTGAARDKAAAPDERADRPDVRVGKAAAEERKLARTARLELAVGDVRAAVGRARQVATTAGGYTGQEDTAERRASVDVLVPSDKLDAVLGELAGLGRVLGREQSARDVTEEVVDVESRLASQRASVRRVRELLERASTISEITSVEAELTRRESELESLQARYESLAGRVAMSTVSLTITAEPPAAAPDDGVLGGLAGGWRALLDFGEGALTVLAGMLPFLVAFGLPVGALGWYWLRRRRLRTG